MRIDEAYATLNVVPDFIPAGNSTRPGTRLVARYVTIHNTDNTDRGANAAAHARYQKGADARSRQVSWHYTVDDESVYQSLPENEIGWHAGSREGNKTSIGIEICMNDGLDEEAAYDRAALLTAVVLFQNRLSPAAVKQHHDWSGKNCPRVLRAEPNGWADFVASIRNYYRDLEQVPADRIALGRSRVDSHHHKT